MHKVIRVGMVGIHIERVRGVRVMEERLPDNGLPGGRGDTAVDSVYIISSDCVSCGICEYMCPLEAIVETTRRLAILKRVCDGCGICVPYCPVRAIVPKGNIRERQALTVTAKLRRVLSRRTVPHT